MTTPNNSDNLSSVFPVPEVVIQRLPLYVRVLTQYSSAGEEVISSEQLGSTLHMTLLRFGKIFLTSGDSVNKDVDTT